VIVNIKQFHSIFIFLISVTSLVTSNASASNDKYNFPPSAELSYQIKTVQSGFSISGNAKIIWVQNENNKFKINTETTAPIFGKIHATQSEGFINEFGLTPTTFSEKRFRKSSTATTFDYNTKRIQFSDSDETYKIKGGEQDRTSATWQLISLVRAAGDNAFIGQQWKMFVAGNRDADTWLFKLVDIVAIKTALGDLKCLHILKSPPPDAKEQQLEIWLATDLNYYPVQIRFLERDGDQINQKIISIK
jgi:hypothetical protein